MQVTSKNLMATNITTLKLAISTLTNPLLIKNFKETYIALNDYKPEKWSIEETQLLEVAKVYKDEIMERLLKGSDSQLIELAKVLQIMMKSYSAKYNDFYTNNLLRIYSRCIQIMKRRNLNKKYIKKEFL